MEPIVNILPSNPFWSNIWFWIAIGEALVIVALLFLRRKKRVITNDDTLFQTAIKISKKDEKESMNNVVNSIFLSKQLYDDLKKKCHPDRFLDADKNRIANELFQELTKNRANYDVLCAIRQKAVNELDIQS